VTPWSGKRSRSSKLTCFRLKSTVGGRPSGHRGGPVRGGIWLPVGRPGIGRFRDGCGRVTVAAGLLGSSGLQTAVEDELQARLTYFFRRLLPPCQSSVMPVSSGSTPKLRS